MTDDREPAPSAGTSAGAAGSAVPVPGTDMDVDATPGGGATARLITRVAHAALAGVVLMFVWYSMNAVLTDLIPCDGRADCLDMSLRIAAWTGVATIVLAGPMLRLVGLRPAAPVALVAPVLLAVPALLLATGPDNRNPYLMYAVVAAIPAAYSVAALITAPMLDRRFRYALIAAVAALGIASLVAARY